MNKIISFVLLFLICFVILSSCSDNKDEPRNRVFAFNSPSKNVVVSDDGLNVVVNANALYQQIDIPLSGSFVNTNIETNDTWAAVSIEDKTLILKIFLTFEERSTNIEITANDASNIVVARIAINQAAPTAGDYATIRLLQMQDMVGGSVETLPADGNFETQTVWYKLNNEGTVYMRFATRASNLVPINIGDEVRISYSGVSYWDYVDYPNTWWKKPSVSDKGTTSFVFEGLSGTAISKYGKGIILALNAGLCYGDDIDIVATPDMGVPDAMTSQDVFIYAVQFNGDGKKL